MIKNYLKTAFRNLRKHKLYSAINIFGLMIGLAACLLIGVYITHELSYDKFNEKANRIFRIDADFYVNGNAFRERFSPSQLGPVLVQDYPQVEGYVRFFQQGNIFYQKLFDGELNQKQNEQ